MRQFPALMRHAMSTAAFQRESLPSPTMCTRGALPQALLIMQRLEPSQGGPCKILGRAAYLNSAAETAFVA